ncbi:uvrABC system protein C [Acidimicrobiaceae bacterium]|nr:uvrABC system protein C [Acidimicrobiaceae bacterium]
MITSSLDGIAGLGAARAAKLIKAMGSVTAVKQASLEDLALLSWLPESVAKAVYQRFHP